MKKTTLLVFLIATSISCVSPSSAQAPGCPPAANLILTIDQYHLSLSDKQPICVSLPGTISIKIHQPGNSSVSIGAGDVTAAAKESTGLMIEGNNNAPINKLKINVSGTAQVGDEFAFLIDVKGVGVLDPKVRVVDNTQMMELQSVEFYDFLDTLGITLDDANKLKPPRPEESE
jgi:hypothetical protein